MSNSVTIRPTESADEKYLIDWLLRPGILEWFPLENAREIEDASRLWISYAKINAALTALWDEEVVGLATLYLPSFRKLTKQSLFAIIVREEFRGKGVGSKLLNELIRLAKEHFHIELLHLEVYEGNPAINLYRKMGFEQYAFQSHFVKEENGKYIGNIMMQKRL
jgi:ribosomal protein S18 acetylase RimI-like enzyme